MKFEPCPWCHLIDQNLQKKILPKESLSSDSSNFAQKKICLQNFCYKFQVINSEIWRDTEKTIFEAVGSATWYPNLDQCASYSVWTYVSSFWCRWNIVTWYGRQVDGQMQKQLQDTSTSWLKSQVFADNWNNNPRCHDALGEVYFAQYIIFIYKYNIYQSTMPWYRGIIDWLP